MPRLFMMVHATPEALERGLSAVTGTDPEAIAAMADPPRGSPGRSLFTMTRMLLKTLAVQRRARRALERESLLEE